MLLLWYHWKIASYLATCIVLLFHVLYILPCDLHKLRESPFSNRFETGRRGKGCCSREGREGMESVEISLLLLPLLRLSSMDSKRAESASAFIPFTLPFDCCGNISIAYPFGIGNGCHCPGFNLSCIHRTTTSPRLFFGDGKIEVMKIWFGYWDGTCQITHYHHGCGCEVHQHFQWLISATGLTVLTRWDRKEIVCVRLQRDRRSNEFHYRYDYRYLRLYALPVATGTADFSSLAGTTLLWGFGFLDSTRPILIWLMPHIKAIYYDANNVPEQDVERTVKGGSTEVEATLAWYINDHPTCEDARKNPKAYAWLSRNSDFYNILNYAYTNSSVGYRCGCCSLSYQGNPYLPNGCQGDVPPPLSLCAFNSVSEARIRSDWYKLGTC